MNKLGVSLKEAAKILFQKNDSKRVNIIMLTGVN